MSEPVGNVGLAPCRPGQGAFASPAIIALASLFVIAYALELSGLLDRAIAEQHAVALLGPPWAETFEPVTLSGAMVGDMMKYLRENDDVKITFHDGKALSMELPQTVTLKVTETEPGIKGATASAQVKPARTETGLVVQVPPFINVGDRIRVSTETGEYQSRA